MRDLLFASFIAIAAAPSLDSRINLFEGDQYDSPTAVRQAHSQTVAVAAVHFDRQLEGEQIVVKEINNPGGFSLIWIMIFFLNVKENLHLVLDLVHILDIY